MIYPKHLMDLVIKPVIKGLEFDANNSRGAEALLLYTAQQESECGRYLTQIGGGPARSPWQIEGATFNDNIDNFLKFRQPLLKKLIDTCGTVDMPEFKHVAGNMYLACAMARIVYRRSPLAIPRYNDLPAMWSIYKSRYNTHLGAATEQEFFENCERVSKFV